MTDSRASILKHFSDLLELAAASPPPKMAGLDGRKGIARRMILSVIDDVMRLDTEMEGGDWSKGEISALKQKAVRALDALNNVA